jgi:hypothetical protein
MVRTFEIHSLGDVEMYNALLLTMFTKLCNTSQENKASLLFIWLKQLCALWPSPPHLHTLPGTHHSNLCFCENDCSRFHITVRTCSTCLSGSGGEGVLFCFKDSIFLCSPGWPQICNPPASAYWVLGLQMFTTIPSQYLPSYAWLISFYNITLCPINIYGYNLSISNRNKFF